MVEVEEDEVKEGEEEVDEVEEEDVVELEEEVEEDEEETQFTVEFPFPQTPISNGVRDFSHFDPTSRSKTQSSQTARNQTCSSNQLYCHFTANAPSCGKTGC